MLRKVHKSLSVGMILWSRKKNGPKGMTLTALRFIFHPLHQYLPFRSRLLKYWLKAHCVKGHKVILSENATAGTLAGCVICSVKDLHQKARSLFGLRYGAVLDCDCFSVWKRLPMRSVLTDPMVSVTVATNKKSREWNRRQNGCGITKLWRFMTAFVLWRLI